MAKDIGYLLKENEMLIQEKDKLDIKLKEASEIIEGIKRGKIDAIFIAGNEAEKVLASRTEDQAYRRFIENMSEGVVTLHTDGIILYSNTSFAKIVDLPLEKVIGTNLRKFIPSEKIEAFEPFFNEYPQERTKVELSILDHHGRRTHFIVSLNTLQLQDSAALNLVWTDVTNQKETEEALLTLNENLKRAIEKLISSENEVDILNRRLKGNIKTLQDANNELATFAHIASHDLQEPLRKIMTYSNILKSNYYAILDLEGQGTINKVYDASARMRNLINDILEYSELSQKDILFKPTDLQAVINEVVSDLEIVIKETKARVLIINTLPVIEANASQMRQLFQNIISNALKFRKADGIPEISITYESISGEEIDKISHNRANEEFYRIHIKDNGIGFNPDYMNKIFIIFQRLNNNSIYPGTGIGLAICKKIVEGHHGFITAESNVNDGALFTITLPVNQAGSHK